MSGIPDDLDNIGNRIQDKNVDDSPIFRSNYIHPYEKLTPDIVINAVESLGYISDARILALNSYENRVYQVGVQDQEPIIIKFYRPERWSINQILEEHEFTNKLYSLDVPVVPPKVFSALEYKTLGNFENFLFSIYPRQGGRAPELDNLEHLFQLGQFIGRIHSVGASFNFKFRNSISVEDFGEKNVRYLIDNNFIPKDLLPAYKSISSQLLKILSLTQLNSNKFKTISLHGDCHPGNILWREERPHFLDFDDAITGPAIQDLWMLLSGEKENRQKQFSEILEGYENFYYFDSSELALIEPLRVLRVLNYNGWLAKRWKDPAFPISFPWFNTQKYWSEHILELKELLSSLNEPALNLPNRFY